MAEKPWRTLRERPDIEFMVCELPTGVRAIYATRGQDRAILLNRDLGPAERLAALAHELVHDERGGGCHHPDAPPLLQVVSRREEARVEQIVVDRLVDMTQVEKWVRQQAEIETVLPHHVAEEFDLDQGVAVLALRRLAAS